MDIMDDVWGYLYFRKPPYYHIWLMTYGWNLKQPGFHEKTHRVRGGHQLLGTWILHALRFLVPAAASELDAKSGVFMWNNYRIVYFSEAPIGLMMHPLRICICCLVRYSSDSWLWMALDWFFRKQKGKVGIYIYIYILDIYAPKGNIIYKWLGNHCYFPLK